ncbi:MAG: AEC family transporter [Dysgonamonadaceae bacterium]|jgi:predicted permease|nr:AEC family transporter [Dysgonamonadaceae bacterium]
MTNFAFSFNVVAPLFVLMATGYAVRQFRFVSGDFLTQLNRFVFKFLLPLMVFQEIRLSYGGDFSNLKLIGASLAGVTAIILVSVAIVRLTVDRKGQRGSMIQGIYRSNFLIYGLPVATGMYGSEAATPITMLMGIMIPFYNVAAVVILSLHSETDSRRPTLRTLLKGIATNPLFLGSVLGVLSGAVHLEFPRWVELPAGQLAATASPLALFVMGGEFRFGRMGDNIRKVIAATLCRLIIIPAVVLFICIRMGFRDVELSVLIALFATPTALASYIMAGNMGNDGELSGQIVVSTTLFSCLTIFLIVFFMRGWGYL